MTEWYETPCPFHKTEDGLYYQGIGTGSKPVIINADEIIKALDRIAEDEKAGNNKVKGIRIYCGRIDGYLNIKDAGNLERFEEIYDYIKLPDVELIFRDTVFVGDVDFCATRFGGRTEFIGTQFGERTEFINSQFGEYVNFIRAKFGKTTDFNRAQFGKRAEFIDAQFGEHTDFRNARFAEITDFSGAQFGERTEFQEVQLGEHTYFSEAQFGEITNFNGAQFKEYTDFSGAYFKLPAMFEDVKYWSDFARVTLARKFWKDKLLFSVDLEFQNDLDSRNISEDLRREFEEKGISLSMYFPISIEKKNSEWIITNTEVKQIYHIERTYRIRREKEKLNIYGDGVWNKGIRRFLLPENSPSGKPQEPAQFYINSQNIDEVSSPTFKRYVADQHFLREFKGNHRSLYHFWQWTSDCGRSMGLWGSWCLLIAVIFGLIYCSMFPNCFVFTNKLLGQKPHWYDLMYYSVVTFTTLGFGDIAPSQPLVRVVVALEVLLGYIMLGILIGIALEKIARRS
ncbi:potassium channel family protein [Candidatus Poribacteria bacterium]|nr:potassium channel family protein [Candidatus Poribacteria bacterium]